LLTGCAFALFLGLELAELRTLPWPFLNFPHFLDRNGFVDPLVLGAGRLVRDLISLALHSQRVIGGPVGVGSDLAGTLNAISDMLEHLLSRLEIEAAHRLGRLGEGITDQVHRVPRASTRCLKEREGGGDLVGASKDGLIDLRRIRVAGTNDLMVECCRDPQCGGNRGVDPGKPVGAFVRVEWFGGSFRCLNRLAQKPFGKEIPEFPDIGRGEKHPVTLREQSANVLEHGIAVRAGEPLVFVHGRQSRAKPILTCRHIENTSCYYGLKVQIILPPSPGGTSMFVLWSSSRKRKSNSWN